MIEHILIYGAGVLGSVYAYRLKQAGQDVSLLARGKRLEFLQKEELVLNDLLTNTELRGNVKVVERIGNQRFDLVLVLVRRNQIPSVLEDLGGNENIKNILFMGNNPSGFDQYMEKINNEKLLFGFGSAAGKRVGQIVHFIDASKPNGKRNAVTLGEMDGSISRRCLEIKEIFESAGIPVEISTNIDSWLKYHVALVSPLANSVYMEEKKQVKLSKDKEGMQITINAMKEGFKSLRRLGYPPLPKRLKMLARMPNFMITRILKKLNNHPLSDIALKSHALVAVDEMKTLADEFKVIIGKVGLETPNIDYLMEFIPEVT